MPASSIIRQMPVIWQTTHFYKYIMYIFVLLNEPIKYEVLECVFSLQNSEDAVPTPFGGQQPWLYLLYLLVKMKWSQSRNNCSAFLISLVNTFKLRPLIFCNFFLTSLVLTVVCTSSFLMKLMPSASREGAWLVAQEFMTLSSTNCSPKLMG